MKKKTNNPTGWKAQVIVTPKQNVANPQGETIRKALANLGFAGVEQVRTGKHFEIGLAAMNEEKANQLVEQMSHKLLSNPVIEDFTFTLEAVK